MKKFILVFINLVIILFLILILELLSFNKIVCKQWVINKETFRQFYWYYSSYVARPICPFDVYYQYAEDLDLKSKCKANYKRLIYFYKKYIGINSFRKTRFNNSYVKPPLILFGCSYVYGTGLDYNQTLSYKLQEKTQRVVYNRGVISLGTPTMLYMLQHGICDDIYQPPEYIIYTFIYDHLKRLYVPSWYNSGFLCCFYKNKNGKLVEKTPKDFWWWHSYFTRFWGWYFYTHNYYNYGKDEKVMNFFLQHILESNKIIKTKFPDTKFVIFVYDGDETIKLIENKLLEEGIKIIYLNDLSNKKYGSDPTYVVDDIGHPSEKFWDEVVPLLVEKLNL